MGAAAEMGTVIHRCCITLPPPSIRRLLPHPVSSRLPNAHGSSVSPQPLPLGLNLHGPSGSSAPKLCAGALPHPIGLPQYASVTPNQLPQPFSRPNRAFASHL